MAFDIWFKVQSNVQLVSAGHLSDLSDQFSSLVIPVFEQAVGKSVYNLYNLYNYSFKRNLVFWNNFSPLIPNYYVLLPANLR